MTMASPEARALSVGLIGVTLVLMIVLAIVYGSDTWLIMTALARRSSLLLTGSPNYNGFGGGFSANVIISIWAMAISTVAGVALGIGMISAIRVVRVPSMLVMNILRNSPWLVVLYAMLYLLPFEIDLFGTTFFLSPLVKAIVGLSLPVTANMAEVFRGGVEAIPSAQWESARSLGYRRLQILRRVVVPQAIPLMTPNIVTTYAMLFIGTSLVVVTGTSDVLSVARTIIASDGDRYATALYLYILLMFFLFCFPVAMTARSIERRVRERS
jgi:polar amino acid transport system permease protein